MDTKSSPATRRCAHPVKYATEVVNFKLAQNVELVLNLCVRACSVCDYKGTSWLADAGEPLVSLPVFLFQQKSLDTCALRTYPGTLLTQLLRLMLQLMNTIGQALHHLLDARQLSSRLWDPILYSAAGWLVVLSSEAWAPVAHLRYWGEGSLLSLGL